MACQAIPQSKPATEKPNFDDPEVAEAIAKAATSPDVQGAIQVLIATGARVRGCRVNSDRAHLQALQKAIGWTIGGYDTRPSSEAVELKNKDRLHVLVNYRQSLPEPGTAPMIAMYDYLCDTLFSIPMRPVQESEVVVPGYADEAGNIVRPRWVECDWEAFHFCGMAKPCPVFAPNRYPYQLPFVAGRRAEHWVLWYFHFPDEELPDPTDNDIDVTLRAEIEAHRAAKGYSCLEYIWYRNPAMSVPDMFHVQVFWRVGDFCTPNKQKGVSWCCCFGKARESTPAEDFEVHAAPNATTSKHAVDASQM